MNNELAAKIARDMPLSLLIKIQNNEIVARVVGGWGEDQIGKSDPIYLTTDLIPLLLAIIPSRYQHLVLFENHFLSYATRDVIISGYNNYRIKGSSLNIEHLSFPDIVKKIQKLLMVVIEILADIAIVEDSCHTMVWTVDILANSPLFKNR